LEDAVAEPDGGADPLRDRILDAAIAVAEEDGGRYDLRPHLVAARSGLPLAAVQRRSRDADAIADAWFARAPRAMPREPGPGFDALPPSGRLHAVPMRRFGAQAAHRRLVGGMIRAKPHPSHPHHRAPMAFSPSRLVHWALEAARLDARGVARRAEEVGLTLVFLRALRARPDDASPGQRRTRRFPRRDPGWLGRAPRRRAPGPA
jgi:hypothetical protein